MLNETLRMTSIKLGELHFAMLDFLCQGTPNLRRTNHIRAAIEYYVLNHEQWNLARFLDFAQKKYVRTLKQPLVKDAFLEDVKALQLRAQAANQQAFPSSSALDIQGCAADFDV